VGWFEVECGDVDGDAVEAGVEVFPGVGCAVTFIGLDAAEAGGNDDVD